MITVGTMRLPQPEPLDDLEAFLRGLEPDGGYWATMRRLADHDHSGGLMGVPVSGAGGGTAEVTITGTEGVTVVESPANTFALGLTASPDASNTVEIRSNGIYSAAGAIPPEYVTDTELATALGPYATDADLTAHAGAADPHPTYLTAAEGNALYRPISYVTDVTITPDASLTATESPANTFALATRLSPDAGNALALRGNGLYSTDTTGAGGAFVDEAGDTMTGTLAFQGAAVDSGGAIKVTSPFPVVTDRRIYGPTSAALSPSLGTSANEIGVRFSLTTPLYLIAVRWYRHTSAVAPTNPKLWDSTNTATPVWSHTGVPAEWADTALGWKEHRLPAGTQLALVAGRTYTLSGSKVANSGKHNSYGAGAVPDSGVSFVAHVTGATGGAYPPTTSSDSQLLDVALRTTVSGPDPAASGAVRLPSGSPGAVAWRNGAGNGDLSLATDASDRLAYSGAALRLGMNPAASGALQLPNDQALAWRNAANTADLPLVANASNALTWGGLVVVTQAALDALTTRVTALESSVNALKVHVHELDSFGSGVKQPTGGIP